MGGSGGGVPRRLDFFRILKEIVYDFQYLTMIFQKVLNTFRNYEKLTNFKTKHRRIFVLKINFAYNVSENISCIKSIDKSVKGIQSLT